MLVPFWRTYLHHDLQMVIIIEFELVVCEDEVYQNGNVIYQSRISGVPVKKCAACIDTVCVWNVGDLRVDIHGDHNRFWGDKMVDVIKFSRKIIVSVIKLAILCSRVLRIESTYPEICSVTVPFKDTIGLYRGLMFMLVALSISCVVLIKL